MRSSRMAGSSSRKSGMGQNSSQGGGGHAIIVRDPETQLDVTPISLLDTVGLARPLTRTRSRSRTRTFSTPMLLADGLCWMEGTIPG